MSSSTTGIHPAFIEEHRLRGKDHRDLDFGRKFEEWLKVIYEGGWSDEAKSKAHTLPAFLLRFLTC
uniref:Paired domain-containing protein n=1 Tax=Parascaris univalens TaxID=6257 RepID=A0A914ZWM1_PARUN